jgi:xanthine dehydrogenase accessory factor
LIFERLARSLRADEPVALASRLDGPQAGAKLLVDGAGEEGDLGTPGLNYAVAGEARALLAVGGTMIRTFGIDGEPLGQDVRVFVQAFAPKPDMFIFGAIDFSRAMSRIGRFLGYRVTVVDARPLFATRERVPDADDVVVAWPDEFLRAAKVGPRTAIVVLTHDVKFDIPLLEVALRTQAAYVGAMGSRRTHAERIELLRAAGVSDADLARISAPVGLDLGARTPEETAISIAAEIVALRYGRTGGRLRDGTRPVHAP